MVPRPDVVAGSLLVAIHLEWNISLPINGFSMLEAMLVPGVVVRRHKEEG